MECWFMTGAFGTAPGERFGGAGVGGVDVGAAVGRGRRT
jgi:hypothetical protein